MPKLKPIPTDTEGLARALDALPEHDYMGLCPAPDTSPTSRDPKCRACRILIAAAAKLRATAVAEVSS